MAIHANSTPAPLSPLFTDPLVRRAFERMERDDGLSGVIAYRPRPRLSGGSAEGLLRGRRRAPLTRQPLQSRLPSNSPATSGVVDAGIPGNERGALLRHSIATAIDRLIAILDGLDAGTEDLEDGVDDEPSLGWTAAGAGLLETDDREADDADDEDGHDRELEDEHGTDLDHGEADPSDYQPWTGSVVARFVVAS